MEVETTIHTVSIDGALWINKSDLLTYIYKYAILNAGKTAKADTVAIAIATAVERLK